MMNHYQELVLYKSYADLRVEASRGYLGILWWVLEPVLYMLVFYIIFGILFHRGGEGYVAFLLTGLVVWRWFDNTIRVGANSIIGSVGMMRQVYVPKIIFPTVTVITNTVKFLVVLAILLIYLMVYGVTPGLTWFLLPVLLVIQLLFIMAITWSVSAIVPFFLDLRVIIDSGLTLLFFLSGVFFNLESLSGSAAEYLRLNPMAILITSYRRILIEGIWPDWLMLGMVLVVSVLIMLVGLLLHRQFDRKFPKVTFA